MKAKSIMVQGTASDVGKSLLCTGLCRQLARDGHRVAPFKSWNMSLNSFVTPSGGEIGIAQALQARAAEVIPEVEMQPVLVKPRGDGKSQVIVRGRPLVEIEYNSEDENYRRKVREIIGEALEELARKYEVIVMEGAGSPAEVNRKDKDVANMFVARLKKTPVLLVADIDRGGALASLVGTLKLLPPEEKDLIAGLIINRFRGDQQLLQPGLDFLEKKTGKPVLGVIPYGQDIKLPEEDSASLKGKKRDLESRELTIAVVRLPRMSNFTDFKSLSLEPDVELLYVEKPAELENVDLIIIPGTKSTTADLRYLQESGLAAEIVSLNQQGRPVVGICGGYQMLGKRLYDSARTEGEIGKIEGLGLLPLETKFSPKKTTHQVKARVNCQQGFFSEIQKEEIQGYEIHMGQTKITAEAESLFTIFERSGKKVDFKEGTISEKGDCFGTYLHGVFNNDNFRRGLLNHLRIRKGLTPIERSSLSYDQQLERNLDKIADLVADNLDMNRIYSIMENH